MGQKKGLHLQLSEENREKLLVIQKALSGNQGYSEKVSIKQTIEFLIEGIYFHLEEMISEELDSNIEDMDTLVEQGYFLDFDDENGSVVLTGGKRER